MNKQPQREQSRMPVGMTSAPEDKHEPNRDRVPEHSGEHFNGVYSANEFLTRINLMKVLQISCLRRTHARSAREKCCRHRGGNPVLEAIRSALRLGAAKA
jgi:NADPH-dependent glutamate synthase beta subunit-like oxidoreductase